MRIWLAPSAYAPHIGGVEELTAKLAAHLGARGHDVLVVTNRHPVDLPARETVDGAVVRRVAFPAWGRRPDRALRPLLAGPAVGRALTSLGPAPDVVHVVCASSQTAPMAAHARRCGAALVLTSQGETAMDAADLYRRSAAARAALRSAADQAQVLTACSAWTVREAARVAPAFAAAEVVLNGVDPADWAATGPAPERPAVAAWGRHVPQKGLDLLLRAFPLVQAQVAGATLEIGGDGPDTDRLRDAAGPGVDFPGPLDRAGVAALLARSRVAVVPSRVEPFGIVALEALAAGRPLVHSGRGGLPEAAGGLGRAADPEDPEALAAAVVATLRGPVDDAPLRARAAELSWDRIVDRYEELYATALEQRAGVTG